jgi:hydroxyacylglutathione hydrolase
MIQIKCFVFNSFQENTYLLYDETNECLIIDAGCFLDEEKDKLFCFLKDNSLKPVKLLNTHCHIDHLLGNTFIYEQFGLLTSAHRFEKPLLEMAGEQAKFFGFEMEPPPPIENFLEDKNQIKFGNSELLVIHVPGHSRGSLAFYNKTRKFILVGDVLFQGGIGRTDLPGGDYETIIKSIRGILFALDEDVIVYPGHGPNTTIGEEKKFNPFFH